MCTLLWITVCNVVGGEGRLGEARTEVAEVADFWYTLLKPVISRLIRSSEDPDSEETKDFWQKITYNSDGGSGPTCLSGKAILRAPLCILNLRDWG